jgi:hypothetical protein
MFRLIDIAMNAGVVATLGQFEVEVTEQRDTRRSLMGFQFNYIGWSGHKFFFSRTPRTIDY